MRISDWSSDVCSSDLRLLAWLPVPGEKEQTIERKFLDTRAVVPRQPFGEQLALRLLGGGAAGPGLHCPQQGDAIEGSVGAASGEQIVDRLVRVDPHQGVDVVHAASDTAPGALEFGEDRSERP